MPGINFIYMPVNITISPEYESRWVFIGSGMVDIAWHSLIFFLQIIFFCAGEKRFYPVPGASEVKKHTQYGSNNQLYKITAASGVNIQ